MERGTGARLPTLLDVGNCACVGPKKSEKKIATKGRYYSPPAHAGPVAMISNALWLSVMMQPPKVWQR